jgi:hypothetical protein
MMVFWNLMDGGLSFCEVVPRVLILIMPKLSSPEQGQPLIIYVSATHSAVSGGLVVEKEIIGNGKTVKQQFQYILYRRFQQDPRDFIPRWRKSVMQSS